MLYVPILKCKQGEKDALYTLRDSVKDQVVPLLEITPDVGGKGNFNGVEDFWKDRPFFLDVSPEYRQELSDEEYYKLIEKCTKQQTIPVIKLADSEKKITKLISEYPKGVALRLYIHEILDDDFELIYDEFSAKLDLPNTDLIIDAQHVESSKINEASFLIKGALNLIEGIGEYRNVIFSSNSFPETLQVDKHELSVIPRIETNLFEKVKPHFSKKKVNLIYSDYAINHWSFFEFIPGMQPSFNIRYTTEDFYVVYKGDTVKKGGLKIEKVKEGCIILVTSPYFKGQGYSWGDKEIHEKATGETTRPGSLTTWRAIGTNHHVTFIVNLLSNQA
ncbi:beta family protein [Heyndrickxia coagulans]|uniref:beta family protein n=1 Tax=Heyndrickxia coagulans TaxID=1398 RepID=UPI002235C3E9|nr:beta family protein [Heyndrickxia coagulans]UZH06363.1 beta family protein [Heyndrickxia coagulans]